jgi:nucleotide-binding universal stress UspA family protein
MLKHILLNIDVDDARHRTTDFAISVARTFDAHLSGIVYAYDVIPPYDRDVLAPPYDRATAELVSAERQRSETSAQAALSHFEEAARSSGVSVESRLDRATLASAPDRFAHFARTADISILTQAEPGKLPVREILIEATLFSSGRPILVVPYIQSAGFSLENVLVCWEGSRNAARAVGDAMPFLARAKSVEVLIVARHPGESDEMRGLAVAHHLAHHGLKIELNRMVARDIDVPNTILSRAADAGTDLIVMGGYGHSRFREFVLGGATRGILGSMTVPVLMSH